MALFFEFDIIILKVVIKMIEYKQLIFDKNEITKLYRSVGWSEYLKDEDSLFLGIQNSLFSFAAYENDNLIGLVRVVGDGQTIIYIQDILINPTYQNKAVGSNLLKYILFKYNNVRQVLLTTDNNIATMNFYGKNGFIKYEDIKLIGYMKKKGDIND